MTPPPPPPPPPPALLTAQPQSAVAVAKKRRWMRNRLDTSALMGRVHRELQERFRRAPQGPVDGQAGHFETPCGGVLSELHGERANGRRLSATCGATRQRREDIRRFLLSVESDAPRNNHTGPHLSAVLQHPDLKEVILREFDCTRHYLRPGEKPKLRVLGLRYGVPESAIRKANDLDGCPVPVGSGRNFLYIPPSEHADTSAPTRITRSELTAKLRQKEWEMP